MSKNEIEDLAKELSIKTMFSYEEWLDILFYVTGGHDEF